MTPYTVIKSSELYELLRDATVLTASLVLGTIPDKDYAKKLHNTFYEKLKELKDA